MAVAQLVSILPARRKLPAAAYILAWVGAAVVSLLFLVVTARTGTSPEVWEVATFLAITAAADAVVLRLDHGRATEYLSLLDAAVCVNIMLFPAPVAVAVTLGGSVISHLILRQHPLKALFNLAQYTVATVVAVVLFHVVAAEAVIEPRAIIGLLVATAAFGLVNSVALSGLISLFEERPFLRTFEEGLALSAVTTLGNASVGILAAAVWLTHPALTVLFIAPAATLHLAYRGSVRTRELLEVVVSERDRLNRIVVGSSDGIALIDADGTVEVWSPALSALTGIAKGDAIGRRADAVLRGTDPEGRSMDVLLPVRTATPEEPNSTTDMVLSGPQGDPRVARVTHTVLFDGNGRVTGDAILVHDITREYESDKLKDDFLARVSHELRTPLTPIKGYAQLLLRRGDGLPPETSQEVLGNIVERADHMTELIDDLLLVSRIVAGRASLADRIQTQIIDLEDLCRRTISSFGKEETDRTFHLEVTAPILLAVADPTRVEQILTNLLSNACKFSASDSPVYVVAGIRDGKAEIEVIDRGRGISPHHIDKVFDRFFRSEDPMTMTTGGVGLGLHIAKELAHAMKGDLTVTSVLGEGSAFSLTLPPPTESDR